MARAFIPALGLDILTPAYDVLIRLVLPERRFKRSLLDAASIGARMKVVDVGTGTGTLLLLAYELQRAAQLVGLDADPRIANRARRKAVACRANVRFVLADATIIPIASGSVDRVVSTLAFHHLQIDSKRRALGECYRILRPEGEIHIGDFGKPAGPFTRVASFLVDRLGGEPVHEQFLGQLPSMMREAGFADVRETGSVSTVFGVIRNVAGVKPWMSR